MFPFFNAVSSMNLIKFSRDDIKVHIYAFQVCFVLFGLVFCAIFLPTFKCVKLQKMVHNAIKDRVQ